MLDPTPNIISGTPKVCRLGGGAPSRHTSSVRGTTLQLRHGGALSSLQNSKRGGAIQMRGVVVVLILQSEPEERQGLSPFRLGGACGLGLG
eukprot:4863493-Amphidinium_carterae.2